MYIKDHFQVDLSVVAPPKARIASVYENSGYLTPSSVGLTRVPNCVNLIALKDTERPTRGFDVRQLKRSIAQLEPDILWIHGEPLQPVTTSLCRWFLFKKRVRLYQAAVENCVTKSQVAKHVYGWLLLNRITGFLAAAEPTVEALVHGLRQPRGKIHRTYLPNIPVRLPGDMWKSADEKSHLVLGFAGRLEEKKGIFVLLEALKKLPVEIQLCVAGHGDPEIVKELLTERRIEYLGLLDDLSALFRNIDVLVVPSLSVAGWREQFGRVIAEAFSCGIPVIGSTCGAIPDVVNGGGLVYPEQSSDGLAECVKAVYYDRELYGELSERARRRYKEYFSVAAHAQCLAHIFGLDSKKHRTGKSE